MRLDQRDLLRAGGRRHDGDERQAQEPGEVRLGDGRRAAGRVDDRRSLGDPAVAQAVEEQRAGESMLQRPRRVDRLVLEVEVDSPVRGQREGVQVRVGRAVLVGLDATDRLVGPLPRAEALATVRADRHAFKCVRSRIPVRRGSSRRNAGRATAGQRAGKARHEHVERPRVVADEHARSVGLDPVDDDAGRLRRRHPEQRLAVEALARPVLLGDRPAQPFRTARARRRAMFVFTPPGWTTVDLDRGPGRRELEGEALREAAHGELRGAVGAQARLGHDPVEARDVHDVPVAEAIRCGALLRAVDDAPQVDVEHPPVLLVPELLHRSGVGHPGVVVELVDHVEPGDDVVRETRRRRAGPRRRARPVLLRAAEGAGRCPRDPPRRCR